MYNFIILLITNVLFAFTYIYVVIVIYSYIFYMVIDSSYYG